jgi:hypothetical protein
MSWPMKVCSDLSFGHMWLAGMVAGLLVAPWAISLWAVPDLFGAYSEVPVATLLKANLFSLAWGIANVLFGISVTRIGSWAYPSGRAGAVLGERGLGLVGVPTSGLWRVWLDEWKAVLIRPVHPWPDGDFVIAQ